MCPNDVIRKKEHFQHSRNARNIFLQNIIIVEKKANTTKLTYIFLPTKLTYIFYKAEIEKFKIKKVLKIPNMQLVELLRLL
jgi:hypothetical protein